MARADAPVTAERAVSAITISDSGGSGTPSEEGGGAAQEGIQVTHVLNPTVGRCLAMVTPDGVCLSPAAYRRDGSLYDPRTPMAAAGPLTYMQPEEAREFKKSTAGPVATALETPTQLQSEAHASARAPQKRKRGTGDGEEVRAEAQLRHPTATTGGGAVASSQLPSAHAAAAGPSPRTHEESNLPSAPAAFGCLPQMHSAGSARQGGGGRRYTGDMMLILVPE